jgi:aconitate hydratase 2 / 2-methylisocitrate dehydratase
MLDEYRNQEAERADLGIPPRPLSPAEVEEVVGALAGSDRGLVTAGEAAVLLDLLTARVSPGVGEPARLKAAFLGDVSRGIRAVAGLTPADAVRLLGTMLGGYNVLPLVELLDDPALGELAGDQLASMIFVFDSFGEIVARAASGSQAAGRVLRSWSDLEWFERRPPLDDELHMTVFKVDGETNTDDLSPAPQAWSRADIPRHALSLLENRLGPGVAPAAISDLKESGRPIVFVGDVVGTGSSRKSAVNSLQWHIGIDIPLVPNKRTGGVVVAGRIAPIFRDTLLDAGGLPIECDAAALSTGDHIVIRPRQGSIERPDGEVIGSFHLHDGVLDAARAGGRIQLIAGRRLGRQAAEALGLPPSYEPAAADPGEPPTGYTLAQKIVGRACGRDGVPPGTYCEPVVSTVGSQDTTGPMNRTELEDLACLNFGADLVLQTFCHTVAYPKPVDIETQATLPPFMGSRGAVVLRPGDGIIHSWLNRLVLPDQVGTGSDSHTRFPLGISFPAGSGLVAFAAAFGFMPVTMPESVLVQFSGRRRPGITLRDLVNAIPYEATRQGWLSTGDGRRQNVFNGRILEIEGLDDITVDEAFELADASAERSAAACTIALAEPTVVDHLKGSIATLRGLVEKGYQGRAALERRIDAMERWIASPSLLKADPGAGYAAVIEIDVSAIDQPLLACPNDPDDVRPLSEVAGRAVDEVFLGSCMTNLGHFQSAGRILAKQGSRPAGDPAVPTKLWIAPPTSMVEDRLRRDGVYSVYGAAGARTEVPGCSLCMGNQARVARGATVVSTSTRNFPNRMGRDAQVFLASAEVATVTSALGRIPTVEEYLAAVS